MRWRRPGLACLAALLCAAAGAAAQAQDQGRFEVRNAYVERANGQWLLDVRLDLALAEAARQAFDEGVPLMLELEAEASVERRFLPSATVAEIERRWQLAYDAISQRYVVTDLADGEQETYGTQADALAALAHLPAIRIADEATLPPDARFGMRVRATVEIGELPAAIKMLLFWKSWSRSTDWYAWNVRP
ncbi:MAG TPA: DUF4390 domain-containing protein [Steroidobacteraceae bacterium]|nr:DUF4390 domain-containing protein [Steroidobacteraceae bacterium]